MQEDTESFNENSNSEVIILSQSNHLEENSLSDEEETNTESALSYDAKLNAKLKELGLYEDGMTIQQKEELLAVVAVSFKTAEEEKNRRRWYEEYANAALSFPDDEIEFSLQQSPESEVSPKASGFPQDFDDKFFNAKNSSSEIEDKIEITEIRGFESSNSNEYESLPSTSQSYTTKLPQQRKRPKAVSSPHRLALEEGNTVTVHPLYNLNAKNDFPTTSKEKRLYLEKSMSQWRPCMSPKDEPLISSRRPMPDEKGDCCIVPESEYNQRVNEFNQDVNLALTAIKQSRNLHSPFGKPYHLTKSGHCLKKTPKVDFYDLMVGVREELQESESDAGVSESQNVKIETLPRTIECAFSHPQSHRDRISTLKTNSSVVNNHSPITTPQLSTKYVQKPAEQAKTFPEIVIEDELDISDIHIPDDFDLNTIDSLEKFDCESDFNAKLPKFSNLRPDLCRGKLSEKEALNRDSSKANSTRNCSESDLTFNFGKENHIDLSSQDGELSDSSSVIDVETIVDDEIEEFVLKRKLLQEPTVSDKQTYANRPKRLKKNT